MRGVDAPPSLFDVSWEDLDADGVERFLAPAGDEGLTWEAKGGGDRSTEIYVEELLVRVKQGWTALAALAADYAQLAQGGPGDARVVVVFNREHMALRVCAVESRPSRCAARLPRAGPGG